MGISERKAKEKEIRRNDIIDAAQNVFFTKGYVAATMDDIAKEAQFSKRTLYVYFDSKEQLYFEIMVRGFTLLNNMLSNALKELATDNAIEQIKTIGFAVYEFSKTHPQYFTAIMDYENSESDFDGSAASKSKDVREACEACYAQGEILFSTLTDLLKRGIAQGCIDESLDVVSTAFVLWSGTIGVFSTVRKKANYIKHYHNKTSEEIIGAMMDVFARALSK